MIINWSLSFILCCCKTKIMKLYDMLCNVIICLSYSYRRRRDCNWRNCNHITDGTCHSFRTGVRYVYKRCKQFSRYHVVNQAKRIWHIMHNYAQFIVSSSKTRMSERANIHTYVDFMPQAWFF